MKLKLLIIGLCFLAIISNAQNITLKWEGSKELDYGKEKLQYPFFNNYFYEVDANSIYVNLTIKTNRQVKLDRFVWEELSPKDKLGIKINSLSSEPSSYISYFYDDKTNAESASIKAEALKTENNKIYKLVSFNISETSKPTSQLYKSTNRFGSTDNPLKSGTFYKIKVDKSGIFKITKQFLQQNGINVSNINPQNFRIYGNGGVMLPEFNQDKRFSALQENAIQVVGEEDGVWNDNDYVLFYAQGPNGYNDLNGAGYKRTETRDDRTNHLNNIYEDNAYYFINFDIGPGKRIGIMNDNLPSSLITRYDEYQFLNEEKFNLVKLGRIWTGDAIPNNRTVTFTTKSPIKPSDNIRYKTQFIGFNAQSGKASIDINGSKQDYTLQSDASNFVRLSKNGTLNNQSGNTINFKYTTDASSNPNATFYFDYAEVLYKEDLNFNNSQMNFRDYSISEGSNDLYGFSISNASGLEQVWDVSDTTNSKKVINKTPQSSTFNFGYRADSQDFNNEFVAFTNTSAYSPSFVARIDNQDLSSLTNIDYLIITQPAFISQAQRLANFHQTNSGFRTEIVDINKIYNEFSSGSKDITAIRDFITKLNSPTGSLKYVLLLGDTSYDFKNRINNNTDIIPSYQSENSADVKASYVTDDYFVMTSPQTGTSLSQITPDLPIGRIPASNLQEAKIMIDKTLAYYNALPGQSSPFGEWRMKLDFVADDDHEGNGPLGIKPPFHEVVDYSIRENFETGTERAEYNVRKLYLDAFPAITSAGGQRIPQINQAISNDMGNSLYLSYFGHGGVNGWAQERILTTTEINSFNNFTSVYSRLPVVTTITCEFTLWDEPSANSAGEQLIKLSSGGPATMITSSRAISVDYGRKFSLLLNKNLFKLQNDDFISLGDAHLQAKKEYRPLYGSSLDHLRVNFLGDPAMKLSRPKRQIIIDNVETPVSGKIRALDFVKIKGHINKADGVTLDTNFNGRVAINIFDKKANKKTLNIDNNPDMLPLMDYIEEPSAIVKSSGKVENGVFTVEFYVPKDINYEVGNGRILAYADNKVSDVFANQPYVIGDINPDGINDKEPPVANLYLNNTNFANGGIADQNPMLLACVKDNMGINSTGAGVGHDITFILDGDVINTTSVNDYYTSGDGNGCNNEGLADYQKGYVTYPLKGLSPGEHQLTFKIWDINNNSTTSTLNFVVKDEAEKKLTVKKLLNWPNPFTNKTYVQFEHNCDDILDVNVQIYTITGKLVRTIATTVSSNPFLEGFRTPRQSIEWDGKDDFGDTVAKGTYIFKIFARSQNQEKCTGSATAVEKMVLLK